MTVLNMTPEVTKATFGGHEKFAFRDGWLKKGIDAACDDPMVFSKNNGLVVLGVGKNMVRSIRHWCLATNITQEGEGKGRKTLIEPTPFGQELMAAKGWDPYLEDTGTLWLLHWQLAMNLNRSLVWHIAFGHFYETEFTKKSLHAFMERQFERFGASTTSKMIEREIDCFLRTYAKTTSNKRFSEDSLDCPLTELDLIRSIPEDNVYRFNIGPKPSLAPQIFGYGLLHFFAGAAQHRRTVALDECIYHPGSPGQVFRLDENSVVEHLNALGDLTDGRIRMQETAGLRQIYIESGSEQDYDQMAHTLLENYYE